MSQRRSNTTNPSHPVDNRHLVRSLSLEPEEIMPTTLYPDEMDVLDDPEDTMPSASGPPIPPPHIAARFYRPTQQRRKGSAASSRRNSMSSIHSSHASGIEQRTRALTQSKYIAHSLRRASILEDRQKRLADRAAHAEKVRMRAATAKAASVSDIASFEERALAAQQARDKILADIAASCAEEVKRAKMIAENIKEKRELELKRMRVDMETKLADAEKRREEYRAAGRKASFRARRGSMMMNRKPVDVLPDLEELKERDETPEKEEPARKPLTKDAAVWRLQNWWRAARRRRAVDDFTNTGLSVESVKDLPFEKVTDLLGSEEVMMSTGRILLLCGLEEGNTGSVEEMKAIRTFLSAFLVLGHPAELLRTPIKADAAGSSKTSAVPMVVEDVTSPRIQELVGKARDLLITFENVKARLTATNNYTLPPRLKEMLPEAYAVFHNGFIAWRARDSNALVEVMLLQFVELDGILQSISATSDPTATIEYANSIRDNQIQLLVRIKKLVGPEKGLKMVHAAVKKARQARAAAKKAKGDTKPRVADQATTEDTTLADLDVTPSKGKAPAQSTDAYLTPPGTPSAARSAPVPVRRGTLLPDNRIVMHELSMDSEYRCSPEDFLEAETKSLQPILAAMRVTADQGEEARDVHFTLLLTVAEHIREKLQRLVKPGNSLHVLIGDIMDIDLAKQQFRVGSFSYEKFFSQMGTLLPKLCAPIRDEACAKLIEDTLKNAPYVERLEALILFIDLMLSDYANHLIHMIAPKLLESAAAYEINRFTQSLEQGEHTLANAEAAWRTARTKVIAEAQKRDPEGINHPKSRLTPDKFYNQMLVDVFVRADPVSLEYVPEMLRLDFRRVQKLSELSREMVTTGAILLQCKNLLKRDIRAPWKNEAMRIMTVLDTAKSEEDAVSGIVAALQAGRSMPAATKTQLRALVQRLIATSLELRHQSPQATPSEPRGPVLRLLLTRLRTHVLSRLGPNSASDRIKATSTAGERLAALGLAEFADEVREMVDEISRVGQVDREAHRMWWDQVARKVEREEGDGEVKAMMA